MPDFSRQANMPRIALPTETPSTFAVVFWVAFAVSTLLVVGQIAFVLSLTPVVLHLADKSGATLPPLLTIAAGLGPIGLLSAFAVVDALVFAVFALAAWRYWIGLLFVPPILYLAGAFGALWVYAGQIMFPR